ncbi:unnamed protein product [Arctia plantaginis]|uniref:BTB domain-containing protein n=1 Tax=Arctia plantaginis TaxID=874455 RepID=A0A8S0Z7H8_ARCPL|nr:unnamed protein product [Arctia plantaginis]
MEGTELGGDQQFCLRWNNFQANITSQFEALRDDEDFVDVTLACEGHRLEAHKVVLSACSPYFKELFKNNPCPHPIIFMRDCEVSHVRALLQFMYVGQVNIAQAQLSAFLRTADALQIRGLTDCSQHNDKKANRKSPPSQLRNLLSAKPSHSTSSSKAANQNVETTSADDQEQSASRRSTRNSPDVARNNLNEEAPFQTSSQMRPNNDDYRETPNYPTLRVKTDLEATEVKNEESEILMDPGDPDRIEIDKCQEFNATDLLEPKMEVMEQEASDDERSSFQQMYYNENNALANPFAALPGNIDLMSGMNTELRDENAEGNYTFFYLSLSRHCHTHTSTRTAAPPANLFLAHLTIEPAVEESARVSYRVRWLGARVSDDARPTRTDRKRRGPPNTARIVPPAEAQHVGHHGTSVVLFKC